MDDQEGIRLHRFDIEGVAMVDIRYWKETRLGPRATKKGIEVDQRLVTKLIEALQSMHQAHNRDEARKPANVER